MPPNTEHRRFALAAGLLLAFILLSGALTQFTLAPGLRIETAAADSLDQVFLAQERTPNPLGGDAIGLVVSVISGLAVLLFIVALLRRENRLSTLMAILVGALLALLLSGLVGGAEDLQPPPIEDLYGGQPQSAGGAMDLLDEEDAAEEDPQSEPISWWWSAVVIVPALIGIGLVLKPYFRPAPRVAEIALGDLARDAADALDSGAEFSDVIQRCYHDMIAQMEKTRSIRRRESMTAREFEDRLIREGVPNEDVSALTRLFELSRYGTITPSRADEAAATRHLRRIASFLGDQA